MKQTLFNIFGQKEEIEVPDEEEKPPQKEQPQKRSDWRELSYACLCTMRESCSACSPDFEEREREQYYRLKEKYEKW